MFSACLLDSSKPGSAPFISEHKWCSPVAAEPSTDGTAGPLGQNQLPGSARPAGKEVVPNALPWLQFNRAQTVSMDHLTRVSHFFSV